MSEDKYNSRNSLINSKKFLSHAIFMQKFFLIKIKLL